MRRMFHTSFLLHFVVSQTSKKENGGVNICITEDKLVESYGKATPRERFRLIYKNYSIFPQLPQRAERVTVNEVYDSYIKQKYDLKPNTRTS